MKNPLDRVPAPLLFLIAGASQYTGAAIAVGLFPLMPPHTVAWLRSVVCAVILLVLVQPWRRQNWTLRTFTQSAVFGVVLMTMNMLFYIAIEYLPLGAAVAIEFAGPVAVAAWGGRTLRQRIAIVLAAFGVVAISVFGLDWAGADSGWYLALGVACALAAGTAWAGYMLIGGRIVTERDGISSLAVGTAAASVAFAPIAAPWAGPALQIDVIGIVIAVGVLTSVIPYMLDQVTLRRLRIETFALLNALLPASATAIALLMLQQRPTPWELVGLAAVSVAVALAGRRTRTATGPMPAGGRTRTRPRGAPVTPEHPGAGQAVADPVRAGQWERSGSLGGARAPTTGAVPTADPAPAAASPSDVSPSPSPPGSVPLRDGPGGGNTQIPGAASPAKPPADAPAGDPGRPPGPERSSGPERSPGPERSSGPERS